MNLSNDEVNIKIVLKSTGMISQNDISLASASNAFIVAFNVSSSVKSRKLAKEYGIEIEDLEDTQITANERYITAQILSQKLDNVYNIIVNGEI